MSRGMCKTMCRECPFKRDSPAGYLGVSSGDPRDFLDSTGQGEVPLPCHMRVKWTAPNAQELAQKADVCRGYLTLLRNECKRPRDPELAALVEQVEADRETVFANRLEFIAHHEDPDVAKRFRDNPLLKRRAG